MIAIPITVLSVLLIAWTYATISFRKQLKNGEVDFEQLAEDAKIW